MIVNQRVNKMVMGHDASCTQEKSCNNMTRAQFIVPLQLHTKKVLSFEITTNDYSISTNFFLPSQKGGD